MALELRDKNDENLVHYLSFPVQLLNPASPPAVEVHLWNKKGGVCEKLAENIQVIVENALKTQTGGSNYQGQEIVDNSLVQGRSNGVVGSGIVDDAQVAYTAIGTLNVGDIPTNTARKLFFRLKSVADTATEHAMFFLNIQYDYRRTQQFTKSISTNDHTWCGFGFVGGGYFF